MIVDGSLVVDSLENAFIKGINPFPLLIGNTQYETDMSPYDTSIVNITTKNEWDNYINNQMKEWGPTFGSNLTNMYYMSEYNLDGAVLTYCGISTDSTGFCGTKATAKLGADSLNYNSSIYVFSTQQWPSNIYNGNDGWEMKYSFHAIDLFAACYLWNDFKYFDFGIPDYIPQNSDQIFGELIRKNWDSFIRYNKPLNDWQEYNEINGYSVALMGGYNKYKDANKLEMIKGYKDDVCQFYQENGIGKSFWWSN